MTTDLWRIQTVDGWVNLSRLIETAQGDRGFEFWRRTRGPGREGTVMLADVVTQPWLAEAVRHVIAHWDKLSAALGVTRLP